MKKLFTLLTLALVSIGSAWGADVLCTAQVPAGQDGVFSNTEGITVGQTGCTLKYSGLQGGSNAVTVSGVDYYKLSSNTAYVQLTLTSGKFIAGDVLTATVTSNGSNKSVNLKIGDTNSSETVTVSSNETQDIVYTLTSADIESDGSIKIYRSTNGSNLRVAVFSVSGTRSSEAYTVTFNAGANGTCGTTSLTEVSALAGVILPAVTPNTGYTFLGWYDAVTDGTKVGDAGEEYHPTANITLYAQYKTKSLSNSYYLAAGDEIESGSVLYFKDISMKYSVASDYKAAVEDNMINALNANYVASVTTGTNGWGVTFTPSTNGVLSVGVVINKDKTFSITNVTSFDYIDKDGNTDTNEGNSWTPTEKFYGIVTVSVSAGETYTFSVSGSKMLFYGFEFTPSPVAEITSAGYATFSSDKAVDFSGASGVTVYAAKVNDAKTAVDLIEVKSKQVPANTAVVLKGAAGTYTASAIASAATISGNQLQIAATTMDGSAGNIFVLNEVGGVVGFYKLSDTGSLLAGKGYLEVDGVGEGRSMFEIDIDGISTGINMVNGEGLKVNGSETYYDLQGRRVLNPTKGLYIVNGKKVIMK